VIPGVIADDLSWHLARLVGLADDALIFTSSTGTPLHDGNFRRRVWHRACTAAGLSGVHFHDLRHTGNDLTAAAGASLRELMERMGHSSTRAALIYLHASTERQEALADAVSDRARAELRPNGRKRGRSSHLARMWHVRAMADLDRGCLGWWACLDLNQGPLPYQGSALTD
jgi:hypothetical protein